MALEHASMACSSAMSEVRAFRTPTQSDLVQAVAANVRAEAARKGFNQTSLGMAIDQAQSSVSRKWWGKRAWSLEDLGTLSTVLRVPVAHLVSLRAQRESNPQPSDP